MRHVLFLFSVLLLAPAEAFAQTWVWPMAGHKAGDNIISPPNSLVGTEFNCCDIYIGGEEDDVVSFKVYDVKAAKVLESSVKERIVFTADAVFGSLRHPYLLHVSGRDGDVCAVAASVVARASEHGDELVVAE